MIATPPVTAQTSESLEWGVEIGDETFFEFYYWSEGYLTLNENVFANITGPIDVIPDPLTDYWNIPNITADVTWVNGTDMGMMLMIFMYIWKFAMPTGNWSLMTVLVENVIEFEVMEEVFPVEPQVIIDNWYQWGYTYNLSAPGSDNVANVTYLKSDGSLASFHLRGYEEGGSTLLGEAYIYRDGTPPIVENPDDIAYYLGDTGHSITWNATDQSPAAYMILKDDVEVEKGLWNLTSEEITVDVDGLDVGSYTYTIVFYEASGISASDQVVVDVILDIVDPIIDHPQDVTYVEGETGNTITWNPSDDYPESYQILKDGIEVKSGAWNSSLETISISVDDLAPGSYNYTIIVTDEGDNTALDTVDVIVSVPTTTTTTTTTDTTSTTTNATTTGDFISDNLMLIVSIGGGAVIIIVIVLIISKKN